MDVLCKVKLMQITRVKHSCDWAIGVANARVHDFACTAKRPAYEAGRGVKGSRLFVRHLCEYASSIEGMVAVQEIE